MRSVKASTLNLKRATLMSCRSAHLIQSAAHLISSQKRNHIWKRQLGHCLCKLLLEASVKLERRQGANARRVDVWRCTASVLLAANNVTVNVAVRSVSTMETTQMKSKKRSESSKGGILQHLARNLTRWKQNTRKDVHVNDLGVSKHTVSATSSVLFALSNASVSAARTLWADTNRRMMWY